MSALNDSMLLAQMNQQQPPQQPQSPFSAGSLAAMDSIRDSLRSNDAQKRNAIGKMISTFGANMGNPANYERGGNGFGAAVASMGPAIQAYDQQNDANRSENMSLMEYMRKLEHEQNELARRKKDHEDKLAYQNAQLAETKRYHDMQNGIVDNSKFQKLKNEGVISKDAISMENMPSNMQLAAFKSANEDLKKGDDVKKMLNTLKEAKKLSDKHPDMYKDFNRVLYEKSLKPGTTWKEIFGNAAMDNEKQTALDEMDKLTSRLVLSEIKSAGGRVASDAFKEIVAKGKPHFGLTKNAMDFVIDNMEKEYRPTYEHAKAQRKALLHGGFIPQEIHDLEGEENVAPPPEQAQAAPAASPREAAREKLIAGGITNEAVIEKALQAKGL